MKMKNRFLLAGILAICLIGSTRSLSPAQAHSLPVLFNKVNLEGYFSESWWKWSYSVPSSINSSVDSSEFNCGLNQSGNIWFLPTVFSAATQKTDSRVEKTFHCSIPSWKVVFFPVFTSICSEDARKDPSYPDLRDCAFAKDNLLLNLEADIDGVRIDALSPSNTAHRAISPLFYTNIPAQNFLLESEVTVLASVSDGWWLILPYLGIGKHQIHTHSELRLSDNPDAPRSIVDTTYVLTIHEAMGKK